MERHLILWDGDCEFCRRTIGYVQSKDKSDLFADSAYQSAPTPPMTPSLTAACEHAVHLITSEGKTLRAGRAVLFILERTGWGWTARLLALPPLIWGVEVAYKIVAQNRPFFARIIFGLK